MKTQITARVLGGGARGDNLTGSCILLIIKKSRETIRLLIDIGLIQCDFKEFFEKNRAIIQDFKALNLNCHNINHVIITHSHNDHVGRLPLLIKNGFGENNKSRIFCTEASAKLIPIMTEDSAKIQAIESKHWQKKHTPVNGKTTDRLTYGNYDRQKNKNKKTREFLANEPLYDMDDVERTNELIKNSGYPYKTWIKLEKGVDLKFYPSGHVLGGAICVLRIQDKDQNIYLGFSGDLGRADGMILPPPEIVEEALDYWFSESTYGGKIHPARDQEISQILSIVKEAVEKKQKIIIPSFTLERAQEIIFLLSHYASSMKRIYGLPFYLDSPMAIKITNIFKENWNSPMFCGQDVLNFNPFDVAENPFLKIIPDKESARALTHDKSAHLIIAGSGMCDHGPVRRHLIHGLSEESTVVCLIGYMAKNSLGYKLQTLPIVKMNGQEIIIKAKIHSFNSFSAHADGTFLREYAETIAARGHLKKIFLVHGEESGSSALKMDLIKSLGVDWLERVAIPKIGQELILL